MVHKPKLSGGNLLSELKSFHQKKPACGGTSVSEKQTRIKYYFTAAFELIEALKLFKYPSVHKSF